MEARPIYSNTENILNLGISESDDAFKLGGKTIRPLADVLSTVHRQKFLRDTLRVPIENRLRYLFPFPYDGGEGENMESDQRSCNDGDITPV